MTQDRIQYFEKVLSKPQPEPFKSWLEELFNEARQKGLPNFQGSFYTPEGEHKPRKKAAQIVIDTPENTDA